MGARGHHPRLVDLVASAYDHALEAKPFASFLPELAVAIGADAAQLPIWSPERDQGELVTSWQMPDDLVRAYREHFWKTDVWRIAAERCMPVGRAVAGHMLVPYGEFQKCEMYNDALRAYGLFDTCAGIIFAHGRSGAGLSLLRSRPRPFYGKRELSIMNALLPHLRRAFELRLRFEQLSHQADTALDLLDRAGSGAVVLDRGRMTHATPRAMRLLDAGERIYVSGGRLRARSPEIDAQLERICDGRDDGRRSARLPLTLEIPDQRGAPALRLTVVSTTGARPFLAVGGAPVVLVIDELAPRPGSGADAVAARFALTPAEHRMLAQLADGATLREAAERRGVSVHTARNQVKQILHKTDCRRQVDLVRLCLASRDGGTAT